MTSLLPDTQHADQFFLIKRSIVADPCEIGVIIQALFEFFRSLGRIVRGLKLAEHLPCELQRLSFLCALQRANQKIILPGFI